MVGTALGELEKWIHVEGMWIALVGLGMVVLALRGFRRDRKPSTSVRFHRAEMSSSWSL